MELDNKNWKFIYIFFLSFISISLSLGMLFRAGSTLINLMELGIPTSDARFITGLLGFCIFLSMTFFVLGCWFVTFVVKGMEWYKKKRGVDKDIT